MKKRIAFILVCLLSLCMLPTMAEAAAISARVVKIDQYGHAQLSLAKADFAGAGFDLGDIVKVTCGSYSKRQIYLPFTIAASGGCERARKEFCRFAARARRGVNDQNENHFDVYDISAICLCSTVSTSIVKNGH